MKYQNKTKSQLITELERIKKHVTELERTEEMLREREEKYRTIYENVNDHLIYIDKFGTILDANDHEATYGRSLEELIGKNFTELGYFDEEDLPKYLNLFKDVITGKKKVSREELEIKHKDGHKIPVEVNTSLVRKNDRIEGFLCIVRNITERKQAEEEIRQRTEDLALINALNNAINQGQSLGEVTDILSRKTVDMFSSQGALVLLLSHDRQSLNLENIPLDRKMRNRIRELTGRTIQPIKIALKPGSLCWEWIHSNKPRIINDSRGVRDWLQIFFDESDPTREPMPGPIQKIISQIAKILDIKSVMVVPLISEGNTFGLLQIASREPFTKSDLKRFEMLTRPLTAAIVRKQSEETLRESEEKYRAIFEQAVDSIVLMEAGTGELVEFNDSACENLDYTREEFEKLKIADFEAIESADEVIEHLNKITREGSDTFETKQRTKDGRIRNILVNARAIDIPDRNYVLGVWRDITERKLAEEALRESEEKYRAIFEQAVDSIVLMEAGTGEVVEFNDSACENLDYTREEFEKLKIADFEAIESADEVIEHLSKITREGSDTFETKQRTKEGKIRNILVNTRAIDIPNRNYVLSVWRDITERKLAEEALRESEEKYRSLVESSENPIYLIDEDLQILYANEQYLSRLGKSLEEVIGQNLSIFNAPWKTNELLKKTNEVFKTRTPVTYEHKSARDNRDFLRTLSPVIDPDTNRVTAVIVISKDITELKQAEKQLRESREQLRSLSAHLQSIREEERSEMARHIHDELGQELTALKMDLAWLKGQLREDQEPLLKKTEAIAELTDSIIQSVKSIATQLRPAMLDDLGVVAALEWEMEEFEKRWGVECKLTILADKIKLGPNRSTAVYRIFMESLINIARHAQATRVSASLDVHDGILEMKIRDNGIGITREQINSPRSFGLIGIRERVLQFQGETIITGKKGKGTTLTVRIPLDNDKVLHNQDTGG